MATLYRYCRPHGLLPQDQGKAVLKLDNKDEQQIQARVTLICGADKKQERLDAR